MKRDFQIAAAQIASVRGDIGRNMDTHLAALNVAIHAGIDVVVFPELSLTGYEPDLAAELAITATDSRLAPLSALVRRSCVTAVLGAPLQVDSGRPALGAVVFSGDSAERTYHKIHLGPSERAYFTPGREPLAISASGHSIGLAICADSSQATHPQVYSDAGADIYAASVFLSAEWYASDAPRLAAYAKGCKLLTVMANHGASVGTHVSVGKSAIWDRGGVLLAQAEGTETALVVAAENEDQWRAEIIRF